MENKALPEKKQLACVFLKSSKDCFVCGQPEALVTCGLFLLCVPHPDLFTDGDMEGPQISSGIG